MPPRAWHQTSVNTDSEVFVDAYQILLATNEHASGIPLTIGIWNLESLAHDREYGIKLVQPDSLEHLLMLARTNVGFQIRQGAVRVIGSALWNNPEAMEPVKQSRLVTQLIEVLKTEKEASVRASLVFAMSAATAGEDGMKEFLEGGGSQLLRELFLTDEPEVQGKCATFVEDNLPANHAMGEVHDELRLWCNAFQRVLQENRDDITSEKVLSSLMYAYLFPTNCRAIKRNAKDICTARPGFIEWLANNVVSQHSETMMELLNDARHMFGNPKAARKTAWEDEPRMKDEL